MAFTGRFPTFAILCILIINIISINAESDGIPVVKKELHGLFRENIQYAYIEVGEDSQRLDLFLNLVSLDPGMNFTVAIPLRTYPGQIEANKTTFDVFTEKYQFDELASLADVQDGTDEHFREDLRETAVKGFVGQVFGVGALIMTSGLIGDTGGLYEHFEFDGLTVDIHSFDNVTTLSNFLSSLNLTEYNDLQDMIDKYGSYNIAIINGTTTAPFDGYHSLLNNERQVIEEFKEFLKENPSLMVYDYGKGDYFSPRWEIPELSAMYRDIYQTADKERFDKLISIMYGLTTPATEGFLLSFDLPLYENETAYFPLGTSPAWGYISDTMVVFSCEDSKELEFNNAKEAFKDGKHYYIWHFKDDAPDYDLEAKLIKESWSTKFKQAKFACNEWLHDHSMSISITLVMSFIFLCWLMVYTLGYYAKNRVEKITFPIMGYLVIGSIVSMAVSFLMTLFFGIIVFLFYVTQMSKKTVYQDKPDIMYVTGLNIMLALPIVYILLRGYLLFHEDLHVVSLLLM